MSPLLPGLGASYSWNLPTGAAMVCSFGGILLAAAIIRPYFYTDLLRRRVILLRSIRLSIKGLIIAVFVSAAWLVVNPKADQPIFDIAENILPQLRHPFMTRAQRDQFIQSKIAQREVQGRADKLTQQERTSRWQGEAMTDNEVRKLSSFTQAYMEMKKGEQVVQRELRNRARARQRWVIGVPLLFFCAAGWIWLSFGKKYNLTPSLST